jgi:hypothetical protein
VQRKLLRPCIALTRALRSEEEGEVAVDVDTLTFDRVLIFLEALALGRPTPAFGLHLCSALLAAAQHLGLRPLEVRPSPHGWHWVLYRWCRVPYRWRRVPHRPCALWHALRTAAETGCAAGVLPGCALSEQGTACQTRHTSAAECCSFY